VHDNGSLSYSQDHLKNLFCYLFQVIIICEFHTFLTDDGVSVFTVYFIFNILTIILMSS
ncbi:hypothetical protein L9F63_013601, partial [Diploptera punctata]